MANKLSSGLCVAVVTFVWSPAQIRSRAELLASETPATQANTHVVHGKIFIAELIQGVVYVLDLTQVEVHQMNPIDLDPRLAELIQDRRRHQQASTASFCTGLVELMNSSNQIVEPIEKQRIIDAVTAKTGDDRYVSVGGDGTKGIVYASGGNSYFVDLREGSLQLLSSTWAPGDAVAWSDTGRFYAFASTNRRKVFAFEGATCLWQREICKGQTVKSLKLLGDGNVLALTAEEVLATDVASNVAAMSGHPQSSKWSLRVKLLGDAKTVAKWDSFVWEVNSPMLPGLTSEVLFQLEN